MLATGVSCGSFSSLASVCAFELCRWNGRGCYPLLFSKKQNILGRPESARQLFIFTAIYNRQHLKTRPINRPTSCKHPKHHSAFKISPLSAPCPQSHGSARRPAILNTDARSPSEKCCQSNLFPSPPSLPIPISLAHRKNFLRCPKAFIYLSGSRASCIIKATSALYSFLLPVKYTWSC